MLSKLGLRTSSSIVRTWSKIKGSAPATAREQGRLYPPSTHLPDGADEHGEREGGREGEGQLVSERADACG